MPIQLSPAALRQANLLIDAGCAQTGFLVGGVIGRHVLIDELVAAPFTARTLARVAAAASDIYGDRIQGAYFCRRKPFAAEWLLEGLVLELGAGGIACLRCEFDARLGKPALLPLREEGT